MVDLLIVLVLAGLVLYLLSLVPLDPAIFSLIRVVIIIGCVAYVVMYLLGTFGLMHVALPRLR